MMTTAEVATELELCGLTDEQASAMMDDAQEHGQVQFLIDGHEVTLIADDDAQAWSLSRAPGRSWYL